ncbi:hypothetical protein K7432_009989 [Basidiobolus ranarum]|uniref:Uncharacterized protein n=1 Tax=Basidiobolus ranarum TaxID=34480 RepID=A0ABR2VW86_9FUNG
MGKEQLLSMSIDLYNTSTLGKSVTEALQLLKPENIAGLEPKSKLPRTGILNPSWFLNTKYDSYISGTECLEAVRHAMRVLNGPVCIPKWKKLEKLYHKSNKPRGSSPKSLSKWCCKIIAKDIKSYVREDQKLISTLPLHLKENLLTQVSKLGQTNDDSLGLFFDCGYQHLNLCQGRFSYEQLMAFFYTLKSSEASHPPNVVLRLNVSFSNIQAPWFLELLQEHLKHLTHLNISGCFDRLYGRKIVHEIASHLSSLQSLNISNVIWLTDSMMKDCIDWSTQLPNLKVLVIENCPRMDGIYIQEQIQKLRPGIHIDI